jgi:hypothetical protein
MTCDVDCQNCEYKLTIRGEKMSVPILSEVLRAALILPNECDRNLEPANIVDGLFALARSLDRLARAMERNDESD